MCAQFSAAAAKMKTKFAFSLFHSVLLLASVVSGFTPVTYPAKVSSECGQYDPLQDEQLTGSWTGAAAAGSSRLQPCQEQILSEDSSLLPISSFRLLPDNSSQWLTSAGLL